MSSHPGILNNGRSCRLNVKRNDELEWLQIVPEGWNPLECPWIIVAHGTLTDILRELENDSLQISILREKRNTVHPTKGN